MKYISKNGNKGTVPSLTSWVKSIEAFLALTKYLHSIGLKSLLLRNINQDPLENFFGAIRAHGVRNIMPSATAFINAYKSLLISNITSYHSVAANCEEDQSILLQSLKYLLSVNLPQPDSKNFEINNEHLCMNEADIEKLIRDPKYTEKCAAVAYCSGWLTHVLKKRIYKDCQTCRHDLESDQMQTFHSYIKIKEYNSSKTWLCYPSRDVFEYFFKVENIVIDILKTKCHIKMLYDYIEVIVLIHINFDYITCAEHKSVITKHMLKKSIIFFISNWCKEMNQILSGKTTFWDDKDEMKVAAHEYFAKHKKGKH